MTTGRPSLLDPSLRSGRPRRSRAIVAATLLAATLSASVSVPVEASGYERPGTIEMVSISSSGEVGEGHSGTGCGYDHVAMSGDARYVAFTSAAPNLDPADGNGSVSDVFVRDREAGRTEIVSVSSDGTTPRVPKEIRDLLDSSGTACYQLSSSPSISANGRYVAFVSRAPLVMPKVNINDVYVRDRKRGTTELVSVTADGSQVPGNHGYSGASISANGRYVAFASDATDLTEQEPAGCLNPLGETLAGAGLGPSLPCTAIYVKDLKTGGIVMASVSSKGEVADKDALDPTISATGRYVVYESYAGNLSPDKIPWACLPGTQPCNDVYLHDLKTGDTELISYGRDGRSAQGKSYTSPHSGTVTPDGRYVVFGSQAQNMVPNDGQAAEPGGFDIFIRDRKRRITERVDVSSEGLEVFEAKDPTISADGRYVSFIGSERDLSDPSPACQIRFRCPARRGIWVHDRRTGATELVLPNPDGPVVALDSAVLDAGGRYVALSSHDPNLVQGDNNEAFDVFIYDRGASLGIGGLLGPGSPKPLSMTGSPRFASTGVSRLPDPDNDALLASDSEITDARLVYRPQHRDLFARIDVDRLADVIAGAPVEAGSATLYGIRLSVDGTRYEIRVSDTGGATFGLFRCASVCNEVARLQGGYGTIGDSIVTAVPLEDLGAERGGVVADVEVFTSIGSFDGGALQMLDTVTFD